MINKFTLKHFPANLFNYKWSLIMIDMKSNYNAINLIFKRTPNKIIIKVSQTWFFLDKRKNLGVIQTNLSTTSYYTLTLKDGIKVRDFFIIFFTIYGDKKSNFWV